MKIIPPTYCPICLKEAKSKRPTYISCESKFSKHEDDPENDHFILRDDSNWAPTKFENGNFWINDVQVNFEINPKDSSEILFRFYFEKSTMNFIHPYKKDISIDELYKLSVHYIESIVFA